MAKRIVTTQYGIFILLTTALFMYTYHHVSNDINKHQVLYQAETSNRNVSVFMDFENGQELYSFATSKDIIIGYNYANIDKHWFLWFIQTNHLSSTQFYWIEHDTESIQATHMINDTDFIKHISLLISVKLKNNQCDAVIIRTGLTHQPLGLTLLINKIRSYFPFRSINNSVITAIPHQNWMHKFGNKSCLHRYINDINTKSVIESVNIFDSNSELTELKGYICRNKNEILTAFDILTQEIGYNNVVLKHCDGNNIYFYDNKQDIIDDFIWKQHFKCVIIEQDLKYSNWTELEIETIEFIGLSFYDNNIIGYKQIIDGSIVIGSETYKNKIIDKKLKYIVTYVMHKIGTRFAGGFDFAVQIFKNKNVLPKIYLIDFSIGGMTGTCQTLIVMRKFDIKNKYFIHLSGRIKTDSTFKMFENLNSKLLFDKKTKKGIYFHTFYPKSNDAIVSIFGDNKTDAYELWDEFKYSEIYETK
eukprot:476600_1